METATLEMLSYAQQLPDSFHEEMLDMAAQNALNNVHSGKGGPFGAVVYHKEKGVIASVANSVLLTKDPTAHAEVNAIRMASGVLGENELRECIIYSSAEPCPMCMSAIYWARIPVLYYSNTKEQSADINFDDAFIYQELAKPKDERSLFIAHIPNKKAQDSFKAWEDKVDKIPY